MADKTGCEMPGALTRLFHIILVAAFFTAWFTDDDLMIIHALAGYIVAALVFFRFIWGLIGTKDARLSKYFHSPKAVLGHLKSMAEFKAPVFKGRNPAASMMALSLMAAISVTVITGLLTYGAKELEGPLAWLMISSGWYWGKYLEDIHDFSATMTVVLVAIHATGAVHESIVSRENLVLGMIIGKGSKNENMEKKDGLGAGFNGGVNRAIENIHR